MIFKEEEIDFTQEPLFLGKGRNIARLDLNIEQWFSKMTEKALGLMWFKNDFSYNQDGVDYDSMDKPLQELFLKNLKFQTLLDSLATRTVFEVFNPITTNPQLEEWWGCHGFFEGNIHSATYAEIIKALPVDAKKIFDDIIINEDIISRGKKIIDRFNDTVKWNQMYDLQENFGFDFGIEDFSDKHKTSIVFSLFALNILEGVLFQTSFITTYAFNENKKMESSAKAVGKINMDENLHLAVSQYLINTLKKNPDWQYIFENNKEEIRQMYKDAFEADIKWIDYLFKDNPKLLGLNANILKEYAKYNLYKVMTAIGFEPVVDKVPNPCSWATKYHKTSNVQVALNEADGVNYLLGRINKHMVEEDWENLKV